ncbi:hypothetical protein CKM354_000157800 [Cercospora kikuchii]|uniref:Uncharacterized protein n=1 Tax=Cercospora kikuchii TaxID=84275 RepID=A0A9P3CDT2_9PEZI|nr:uncharacterized protein CKM354_000157800 [Cercospora kikuchii]GIZ38155.1 hypothetical protein CKM354_000157800 [Cercospora kikuchii]
MASSGRAPTALMTSAKSNLPEDKSPSLTSAPSYAVALPVQHIDKANDDSPEADSIVARKRHDRDEEDHIGSSKKQKQSEELHRSVQASTKAENQQKCVAEIKEAWGEDYTSWPTHQFAPLCARSSKSSTENEDDIRKRPSRWHLNLLRPVVELSKLTAEREVIKRALQQAINARLTEPSSSAPSSTMTAQDIQSATTSIKMGAWKECKIEKTIEPSLTRSATASPRPRKVVRLPAPRAIGAFATTSIRDNSEPTSVPDEGLQVTRNRMQVPDYFPQPQSREHDEILEQLFGPAEDAEDRLIRENVRQYISFTKKKQALGQERAEVYRKVAEIDQKAKELNQTRKEIRGLEEFGGEDRDDRQCSLSRLGSEEL